MSFSNDILNQIVTYRRENQHRCFLFKILNHMADYKRSKLRISLSGLYRGREYNHILPERLKMENLLPCCKKANKKTELAKVTLHECFHHLNSSQAMCINFFLPIIDSGMLKILLPGDLSARGFEIMPETSVFEMSSQLDNIRGEIPTTFDFFVKARGPNGRIINLYVEVKYTENGFGKAKNDKRHKEKIKNLYLPLARVRGAINNDWLHEESFRNQYQIMRNLVHIDENSYVIFVYPAENKSIAREAEIAAEEILNKEFKRHLFLRSWDELMTKLASFPEFEKFKDHYSKFVEKYLPWLKENHSQKVGP